MASIIRLIKKLYKYRGVILAMALHEFRIKYIGTFAGFIWSVANPLIMMLVFWFIFSVGFRAQPMDDMPYIVYFLSGFVVWVYFSETIASCATVVRRNAHLVTKSIFPSEILVFVCVIANLLSHIIMLFIFFIILCMNNIPLSIYCLQSIMILFSVALLTTGIGWFVSALNVFYKDTEILVGIILNIGFWMTPIVWVLNMLPKKYQIFIKLNPMFFIVDGYRVAFINRSFISLKLLAYFWIVVTLSLLIGAYVFKRLKHEFAEVL